MADQEEITREEFRVIFGSSGSEEEGVDCSDDSDIDFEGFPAPDSDSEASEDGESEDQSDEEEEFVWSTELQDFALEDFESAAEIKVDVPNDSKADFYFGLLFGDALVDMIVTETNRYARAKLANLSARLLKWNDTTRSELKAFFGISIIMGITKLPRMAMYWSSDPYIGNPGIQSVMTKNRFEELCQSVGKMDMIWPTLQDSAGPKKHF
ncbi:hypothetical protein QZH41_003199 [Actinostola sp. cb2023]|nr:hypothetical protein QZH41_003199 [Actinostola sp. cb2023]